MQFDFIPHKLIKEKNQIIIRHSHLADTKEITPNNDLKNFIFDLVKLETYEIKSKAMVLTRQEMTLLAKYLPYNFYNVNMKNLFEIFLLRVNKSLCTYLFWEWQNSYDNNECNLFLHQLLNQNEDFRNIIKECHLTVELFHKLLNESTPPIFLGQEFVKMMQISKEEIREKLSYFGIKYASNFAKKCEDFFYIFCMRKDYLGVTDNDLLLYIKKYTYDQRKLFLKNFLAELRLKDLAKFNLIAEYFLIEAGENKSENFRKYFDTFPSLLVSKYVDWTNTYKLHKLFENDERSLFWSRYHHEVITKYEQSNCVVMNFKTYVAIEFLGRAMGPCYIYSKKYFEDKIKQSHVLKEYDNQRLRKYLYNNTDYSSTTYNIIRVNGIRLVHNPNPGWQRNFDKVLMDNDITERISLNA